MISSKPVQISAFVLILLGTAYFMVIETPFPGRVLFVLLCISWATWCFVSVLKGSDEVVAAGVRYGLAFASGIGIPISCAIVLLMSGFGDIQSFIAFLASYARSDLPAAAAGFGLGVTFTMLVLTTAFLIGLAIWWAPKR